MGQPPARTHPMARLLALVGFVATAVAVGTTPVGHRVTVMPHTEGKALKVPAGAKLGQKK